MRVPCRSPLGGVWRVAQRHERLTTHLVDLHATTLDMAGVVAADPHKSNGSALPPLMGYRHAQPRSPNSRRLCNPGTKGETHTCVAEPIPNEHGHGDGVVLTHSTQGPSTVQRSVAVVLGVKQHMVAVKQQHAGGAFGAKMYRMYRNVHVACATSVAATRLRRPVRLTLDLQTDMQTTGGRRLTHRRGSTGTIAHTHTRFRTRHSHI
jgi:hypothetical protein